MTLDKGAADPNLAYNDYFEDGLFFWESQRSNTHNSKWIRKVLEGQVIPLLFVREFAKVRGKTQPFIYAGRLVSPEADPKTSKPVRILALPEDILEPIPASLQHLIAWKPNVSRRAPPSEGFAREIVRKRTQAGSDGQGLEADPKVRRAIELHAMAAAREVYERNGYLVKDVSSTKPYDFLCSKVAAIRFSADAIT